jgi:predicted nucleic acid-binding protein
MFLFDTDVLSNLVAKRPSERLLGRLADLSTDAQYTASVCVGEITCGIHRVPRAEELRQKFERLVWPRVRVVPYDRNAALVYGMLRYHLDRVGSTLADPDLMIAAISLSNGFALVTGNVRHFAHIPNLKVENWL